MEVSITSALTIVAVLSVVAERTVELLKGVIPFDKIADTKLRTLAIQGAAVAIAAVTAITSAATINPQLPTYLQGTYGYILLALMAGTGSVGTHQAFSVFESWKKIKQEELQQSIHSTAMYASDVAEREAAAKKNEAA